MVVRFNTTGQQQHTKRLERARVRGISSLKMITTRNFISYRKNFKMIGKWRVIFLGEDSGDPSRLTSGPQGLGPPVRKGLAPVLIKTQLFYYVF